MIQRTDEEEARQLENIMNKKGKTCKNCCFSGYSKGDDIITCGHHIENFSSNSFCAYWSSLAEKKQMDAVTIYDMA